MKELVVRMSEGHIKMLKCTGSDQEVDEFAKANAKARWDWTFLLELGWVQAKLLERSIPEGYEGYKVFYKGETADELLEITLATHDWWHQQSDDFRYYNAGQKSLARIAFLRTQISDGRARELWNMYAPEEMQED